MKKSLLALAVLGAFATAAQATDVTMYGIADGGLIYRSGLNAAGNSSIAFASGIEATDRWGVRGSEDLGGGLKSTFSLEKSFNLGNGTDNTNNAAFASVNGKFFDRGANVGLAGSFGSITMGRNWTPFVLSQIPIDSNGFSNFGSLNSLAFQAAGSSAINQINAGFTYYWTDNSIVYNTPNFGGFHASAMYGVGGVVNDNSAGRTLSLGATFAQGPLAVSAGYFDSRSNTNNGSTVAVLTQSGQRADHIGAKYNFGFLAASLEWANYKNPAMSNLYNTDFYDAGVSVPFGSSMIGYFNWMHKKDKNVSTSNANLYKFALDYNLSKTTTLYANVGFTKNGTTGTTGLLNAGYTAAGENQTAIGLGMRKAF